MVLHALSLIYLGTVSDRVLRNEEMEPEKVKCLAQCHGAEEDECLYIGAPVFCTRDKHSYVYLINQHSLSC